MNPGLLFQLQHNRLLRNCMTVGNLTTEVHMANSSLKICTTHNKITEP